MLAVAGYNSTVVQALLPMLDGEEVARLVPPLYSGPLDAERYLLCAGLIRPKTLREQSSKEIAEGLNVNFLWPVDFIERLMGVNDSARVCIVGSESGFTWSHDDVYAAAKAALHKYVETKKIKPKQQLVCISPSIIEDSGMTQRRTDRHRLAQREQLHPKRRFLKAAEVARAIYFTLYQDEGYYTGQVMRINGGP